MASSAIVKRQYREFLASFKAKSSELILDLVDPEKPQPVRNQTAAELQLLIDAFTDKKKGIHRYEWNLFTHHRTIPGNPNSGDLHL